MKENVEIQGGAMNRGLLFSGPQPPQLRIREPQKWRNPIGYGPGSIINKIGGGMGISCHGSHLPPTYQ
jgi:hypothetical protein